MRAAWRHGGGGCGCGCGLLLVAALLSGSLAASSGPADQQQQQQLSPERCVVWGPGLRADAVLPVRYFYIQAVNVRGENLTASPGGDAFRVRITALREEERVRVQAPPPLDRQDGSFLVLFRLHGSSSSGLTVTVTHRDHNVALSPYHIAGPVYDEYCECPEADAARWRSTMRCPSHEPQLEWDLASFPSVDLERLRQEVPQRFANRGGIIHYAIIDNQLFRRQLGKYTDFKMFSDEMLLSLLRKVRVPDVEFFLNVGDWPLETRAAEASPGPAPIFSWCGSTETRDIVLPTYELTHSMLETLRGVTVNMLSVQGNTGPRWENKTERAFFRGRDSREERLLLATLSQSNPELLDAGITAWFFFREREKEVGKVPLVGFFDFFKFKYQVNVDGSVAAYRLPYLLLGDSLVLKQESHYYEHFYGELRAGQHFLSVRRDLSDLLQSVRWARAHDGEARRLARAGQRAARRLLQPARLYCYYQAALLAYAGRQRGAPPQRHPHMELVTQQQYDGNNKARPCVCHRATATPPTTLKEEL